MVVRELKTLKPSDKSTVTFNIPESEKAVDEYLSEFETRRQERVQNWKWPARQNKIDRDKLKAVIFVQDKETKRVYNAFVADIAGGDSKTPGSHAL
jgi:vacuolar-type H+-ATPase catalytic subunit A/Vma1